MVADTYGEIAKELKELHKPWSLISNSRPRPYSRLTALIYGQEAMTLEYYCTSTRGEEEVKEYVQRAGACTGDKATIYRGVGSESRQHIDPGDWVALSNHVAEWYAEPGARGPKAGRILTKEVDRKDVRWAGTDATEWYYIPQDCLGRFDSIAAFLKHYHIVDDRFR